MKQYYEKHIIESLFREYFLEKEIISYDLCERGVENSNFFIYTRDRRYVLKIFENSKNEFDIVQCEVQIMSEARENGIHVPEIFTNQDTGAKIIMGPNNKPVMLMEFIEGVQFRDLLPDNICLSNVGLETARLHLFFKKIGSKYPIPNTHKFDFKYIIQNSRLRNLESDYIDNEIWQKAWGEIDTISPIFLSFEQQIIHNDLNSGNVVFYNKSQPFLIDFSDIVVSSRIQEIAISFTQWFFARNWYPEGMVHYLKGYESLLPLSEQEKSCLFACVQIRLINICAIPYLETQLGNEEEFLTNAKKYMTHLKRFQTFGKENFMKFIV